MKAGPRSRSRFLGAAAIGTLATAQLTGVARADTVLRLSLPEAQTHPVALAMFRFAKMVGDDSKGAMKVEVYPNSSLSKEQENIQALQTGTVDLAMLTTAYIETISKRVTALDLPFLFNDRQTAERVLDGEVGRLAFADLASRGIIGLGWGTAGWREITFTDKRVVKPEDMKGLRVRIQAGTIFVSIMKALGAIPITIDITETYLALQQHTVDGLDLPLLSVLTQNFYQVAKHVSLTNHLYNPMLFLMSKKRFDVLSPDQQHIVTNNGLKARTYMRELVANTQESTIQALRDKGLTIDKIDYALFRKAMDPVYTEFRDRVGADIMDQTLAAARSK